MADYLLRHLYSYNFIAEAIFWALVFGGLFLMLAQSRWGEETGESD